jgi:hypothetical protein
VNESEQSESGALPLAEAAARLKISTDALRMRINRGKVRGFKKGGRLYAVLDEAPDQDQRTAHADTEQTDSDRSEQARDRSPSFSDPDEPLDRDPSSNGAAAPEPDEPPLPLVVEFQKIELSRLLRDNSRLNKRVDQFMEELRHLREMQQREQVLRQQDQTLWQQTQAMIERLTAPPAPAAPVHNPPAPEPPAPEPHAPDLTVPRPFDSEAGDAGAPANTPTKSPAYAYVEDAPLSAPPSEPLSVPLSAPPSEPPFVPPPDPLPAPLPAPLPTPLPTPPPGEPDPTGKSRVDTHRNTADLADMLKEIGAALRSLDSDVVDALAAAPPDPPLDPPLAEPAPPPGQGARHTPNKLAGPPANLPLDPPRSRNSPEDDEAGLLEILGRMGPSAEERRTAGRIMKRLLKGRGQRRRNEPGDDVP